MKNLAFRLLETYAEARSGAVTCNTNFPRVWPATPRSNASLALASGIVSAMTGRIAPESINAAISSASDESIPRAQLRLWRVLIHELLRASTFMQSNGFHCDPSSIGIFFV
jgi:hypothetical protein